MASVQTKNWAQSEGLGALSEGRENLLGRKEPRRIIIEDLCASEKKKKKKGGLGDTRVTLRNRSSWMLQGNYACFLRGKLESES